LTHISKFSIIRPEAQFSPNFEGKPMTKEEAHDLALKITTLCGGKPGDKCDHPADYKGEFLEQYTKDFLDNYALVKRTILTQFDPSQTCLYYP